MPPERPTRILRRLVGDDGNGATNRLCAVCAEVTEMTGAGIMLLANDRPQASVCTSDAVSAVIEELQYTLGEGPAVDAHREGVPVTEPDLAEPAVARWPVFARSAVEAGARAVFGFPVAIGEVRVGALNLYRDRPGALTQDQYANALVVAEVAGRAILGMQADAEPETIGNELASGGNFRFAVHQAAGMVAVQLGLPVDDALQRLRAHAFSTARPIGDVADEVLQRRLRFTPSDES